MELYCPAHAKKSLLNLDLRWETKMNLLGISVAWEKGEGETRG